MKNSQGQQLQSTVEKENERVSRLYHQKKSLQPTAGTDSTNNDHEDEERTKKLSHIR